MGRAMSVVGEAEPAVANLAGPARRRYWVRRVLAGLYGAFFGVVVIYDPSDGFMPPSDWQDAAIRFSIFVAASAMIAYAIGFRPRRGARFWQILPWGMLAAWIYSCYQATIVAPNMHDDVALALGVLTGSFVLYPFMHLLFRFRNVGRLPEVEGAQAPRGVKRWLGLRAERDVWSGAVSHPRWFQFGIAGPALLVTLWCVWLGLKVEQLRGQREAVVRLEASHAKLEMHHSSALEDAVSKYLPDGLLVDVKRVEFEGVETEKSLISALLKCRNLEGLQLGYGSEAITDGEVRMLSELHTLKDLDFGSIEVTDATLIALGRRQLLEKACIHSYEVTDVGIRAIANCPLTELDILAPTVTDEGMATLGECATLERLSVFGTETTDQSLASIVRLPKLDSLRLVDVEIDGSGFASVGEESQLTNVTLNDTKLNDDAILHLANIPSLTYLEIEDANLTDASAPAFRRLTELRVIKLHDVDVADEVLASLCSLPVISHLALTNSRATGETLWSNQKFPPLWMIDVSDSPISDLGFAAIVSKLNGPCRLVVDRTRITDLGFRLCKPTPHVVELFCNQTLLTDDGIRACRKFDALQTLSCEFTLVTPRAIDSLRHMRWLDRLYCEGTSLDSLGKKQLSDQLPRVVTTKGYVE
jgi:hypothetical protein